MSETRLTARVLLLDEKTGQTIGEVEIITDSQEIFYTNEKPMLKKVGNLQPGTTFDKYSLARILDDILYETNPPVSGDVIMSNGDTSTITDDITIIKPIGSQVDEFTINATVYFGSYEKITATLYISSPDGSHTADTKVLTQSSASMISTSVTFTVPAFQKDASIRLDVSSDDGLISQGPTIHYHFVSPIFVGWITPDCINDKGEITKSVAEHYLQEAIDHEVITLNKQYVDIQNVQAYVVPGINYDTREQLNPCILIPQTWGELKRIDDMNGNNIANSYAHYVGIDINTHDTYIEHYIAYISRQTFNDDDPLIGSITYVVEEDEQYVNIDNVYGNNIPLQCGFTLQYGMPLDERFYRKTYGDLLTMIHPYPGLLTFVEDINTTFRYEKGHWTPVCTKTHVVESIDELTEDLGGWDDLAIVATAGGENIGSVWKKRYNNQWERYGDIKAEDGNVFFQLLNLSKEGN